MLEPRRPGGSGGVDVVIVAHVNYLRVMLEPRRPGARLGGSGGVDAVRVAHLNYLRVILTQTLIIMVDGFASNDKKNTTDGNGRCLNPGGSVVHGLVGAGELR